VRRSPRPLLAVDRDRQQMPGIHFQVGRAWSRTLAPPTRDLGELARLLRSDNPFLVELGCQFACELAPKARPLAAVVAEIVRRDHFSVFDVTSPNPHPGWRSRRRPTGGRRCARRCSRSCRPPIRATPRRAAVAERLPTGAARRAGPAAADARPHGPGGAGTGALSVATLTGAVLPVAREAATTLA